MVRFLRFLKKFKSALMKKRLFLSYRFALYVLVVCLVLSPSYAALLAQTGRFEHPSKSLGIGLIKIPYDSRLLSFQDKYFAIKGEEYAPQGGSKLITPKFSDEYANLCYFICLEKTTRYYRILINALDERYIKVAENAVFLDWQHFLSQESFTFVSRKDWNNNRIRTRPNETAAEIRYERTHEVMIPLKTENEWLKVKFFSQKGRQTGWIRWCDGVRLLINIHY